MVLFPSYNPTKSREERNRYIKYVLPVAIFSNLVTTSTQYGFNVWLIPVSLRLYGSDAIYSMRNSVVLLSFSSQMIMGALVMELMAHKLMRIPTPIACTAQSILYPLGLILSGLSLQYSSGTAAELGLFFSQFLLCGTGLAVSWYSGQVKTVMWFREIGRPAVGAGLYGFLCGFWPMTFSYWGTAMVNNLKDIHVSFYYTAAVLFVLCLPSVFIFYGPNEVPLTTESAAEVGSDIERGDGTQTGESDSLLVSNTNSEATSPLLTPNPESSNESESDTGLTEVDSPLLTKAEFNRQPQVYIQSIIWFLTVIPGFSIKFTIAPVMSAVFGASLRLQLAASFIFLGSYALARLFIGFIIGKRAKVNTVARVATAIIPVCFFLAGAVIKMGLTYKGWMWAFIVVNVFVACSLGVGKFHILCSHVSCAMYHLFLYLSSTLHDCMVAIGRLFNRKGSDPIDKFGKLG